MKLNVDVLYDALSLSLRIRRMGKGKKELCLARPEFYDGKNNVFHSDRLYICMTDRLPPKPVIESGAVLICVGGRPGSAYTAGRHQTCCLWPEDPIDLFSLFNHIQRIFDRYDAWDAQMQHIQETSASIQELIDCCFPIFENPLVVMDTDFHVLAYSDIIYKEDSLAFMRPDQDNKYAHTLISESLGNTEYNRSQQKAFTVLEPERNAIHFSTNLYTSGKFVGNLKISFVLRPHRESDNALACYLARVIEKVFSANPRLVDSCVNPLNGILRDLLNGIPIELSRKQHLYSGRVDGWYLCAKIVPSSRTSSKVTSSYMLRHIESTFPGCSAFEIDGFLVMLIDLTKLGCDSKTAIYSLRKLLKEMDLKAGISCPFQNLLAMRPHFRQAVLALEFGESIDLGKRCYCFADYKLTYMCTSSLGEFSVDNMMTEGLARLVHHDTASQTNYIQTLKVYLNNNMNSSRTSQELYVHRSTFQERISRIEAMLEMDLSDPKVRLYLQMMLHIFETRSRETIDVSGEEAGISQPEERRSNVSIRILDEY